MTKSIQVRVSEETIEAIELTIEIGYAKNLADFAEKSIVSKLEELGIFHEKLQKILEKRKREEEKETD